MKQHTSPDRARLALPADEEVLKFCAKCPISWMQLHSKNVFLLITSCRFTHTHICTACIAIASRLANVIALPSSQVAIPANDTMYHCTGFKLPEAILSQERYIVQVSQWNKSKSPYKCNTGGDLARSDFRGVSLDDIMTGLAVARKFKVQIDLIIQSLPTVCSKNLKQVRPPYTVLSVSISQRDDRYRTRGRLQFEWCQRGHKEL